MPSPKNVATRKSTRFFRPNLEKLESRLAPAVYSSGLTTSPQGPVSYDGSTGTLTLLGNTAQLSKNRTGIVTVSVDGKDTSLSTANLHQISTQGSLTLTGAFSIDGSLSIDANSLTIEGSLSASDLTLTSSGLINVDNHSSLNASKITATTDSFVNVGTIEASAGKAISISARNYLNAGGISAPGGSVKIAFTSSYNDTVAALTSANGGGQITIDGGSTGRLFSSGSMTATGTSGGSINLFGKDILLIADKLDVSGSVGQGGKVKVMSVSSTDYTGHVAASGTGSGSGGSVEISSHGQLSYGGTADAGQGGKLLLDPKYLVIDTSAGAFGQYPAVNSSVSSTVLSNGNIVSFDSSDTGTLQTSYLYNGKTGALISTLVIGAASDDVNEHRYSSVTSLTNGNYVIWSVLLVIIPPAHLEQGYAYQIGGSATWGSGTSGVSGVVSESNSLIGQNSAHGYGHESSASPDSGGVFALPNGNYVVSVPDWNANTGSVTWGNGSTPGGEIGDISSANSLVGSTAGDKVGESVTVLTNGNYVVDSYLWNSLSGAITWGSGTSGVTGVVSGSNSMIGNANDEIGSLEYDSLEPNPSPSVVPLTNGNYVFTSSYWNGQAGAATFANGSVPLIGQISAANSLIGSRASDFVGDASLVTVLSNGNYVVSSPIWNNGVGAATWGSGSTGVVGTISAANSLVGTIAGSTGDRIGEMGITALTNGNYVVDSPFWNGKEGALTWGNGAVGMVGYVSASNSLTGGSADAIAPWARSDYAYGGVTALANGNYILDCPFWNGNRGAVTWGNGATGTIGAISAANSLIGSTALDLVGGGDHPSTPGIVGLTNGNYVVISYDWDGNLGAVTWASGTTGVSGTISSANSLIGSAVGDQVGSAGVGGLTNGNYVVLSPSANGGVGAVTLANGSTGLVGTITPTNSLEISGAGIHELGDGDFLVYSGPDNDYRAASETLINGATGKTLDDKTTVTSQNTLTSFYFLSTGPTADSFTYDGGKPYTVIAYTHVNDSVYSYESSQTVSFAPSFITTTLNTGTDVTLQASDDITVNSPIIASSIGTVGNLTLQAGRSIFINANIDTGNGSLTLTANDTLSDGVVDSQRDLGNAVISMSAGTTINTKSSLYVFLFNGTDKSNNGSGAITMAGITAGSLTVYDPTGTNSLALKARAGSFTGSSAKITVSSAYSVNVIGNASDVAYLYDVSGQNAFVGSPTYSFFEGAGFYDQAVGFKTVNAFAASGSNDTSYLYDTPGNNVFVGTPTYSYLSSTTYFNQAVGFKAVNAYSSASSHDAAYLFDTSGSNTFVGTPIYSSLTGKGYFNQAVGFQAVHVTSKAGTTDAAYLYGAASGNTFNGSNYESYLYGTGYLNDVIGFKQVIATGTSTDTATLNDGVGTNTFIGQGASGALTVGSFSYEATNFGSVTIVQDQGSFDQALLSPISFTLTKVGTWH